MQSGVQITYDIIKELGLKVYRANNPNENPNKPFIILNSAFGITYPTLQNPGNIVGEGVKVDYYSESYDELETLFNRVHAALISKRRMIDLVTKFTFEEDRTPNAVIRMTVIYRVRSN